MSKRSLSTCSFLLFLLFLSSSFKSSYVCDLVIFSRDSTKLNARYVLRVRSHYEALFSLSILGYAPRSGRLGLVLLLLKCEHADRRTPRASLVSVPKNHHLRKFMRQRIRTQQRRNRSASSSVKTGTCDRCRGIIVLFWSYHDVALKASSKQCGLTSNVEITGTFTVNHF